MRVHFWGTRGSLPAATEGQAIRTKIKAALLQASGRTFKTEADLDKFIDTELEFPVRMGYGGNSSCVQIIGGDYYTLCDMGSGLRCVSEQIARTHPRGQPQIFNFFMSHVHWDHIMGFPFFRPAYAPTNEIRIHGSHAIAVLEEALRRQHSSPCFPVEWEQLRAKITFVPLEPDRWYDIDGLRVKTHLQPHPGDSYGYRFEKNGKALVYSTDGEYKLKSKSETAAMIEFYRGADLVIFDAMYLLEDVMGDKQDWGHSSNVIGADLCLRAGVKHYCMFHHDPARDDAAIHAILKETHRFIERKKQVLHVSSAYDGLTLDV